MTEIDLDLLATVTGAGTNTDEVSVGPITARSSQTDYQVCTRAVQDATRAQYPDTRPWYNPLATDTNLGRRGQATMENLRSICGPPPRD